MPLAESRFMREARRSAADEPELRVRPIRRADWAWIQRWFEDETLDRELGPLDEEWLAYVLSDTSGAELVVEELVETGASASATPVALVGVAWGDVEGGSERLPHTITAVAIDPHRRRSSFGRRAIEAALAWPGHPPASGWVAFVVQENPAAHAFFTAIGWRDEGLDSGEAEVVSGDAGSDAPAASEAMHRFAAPWFP